MESRSHLMPSRAAVRVVTAALLCAALALVLSGGEGWAGGAGPPDLAYWAAGDLWLARADGTETRRLTDHGDPALRATTPPAWSPDGRYLAYFAYEPHPAHPGTLGDGRLLLLDAETGQERLISDIGGAWPPQFTWAPGGRALLLAWPSVAYEWYDAATGRRTPIDLPMWHNQKEGGGTACGTLWHVSPDVEWVAYLHEDETLRFRHLLSGRERLIGPSPGVAGWVPAVCHQAAWSSDGRWFAWMQLVDDGALALGPREEVFALRRDAAIGEAVLVRTGRNQKGPTSWRPYGRRLMSAADWEALGAVAGPRLDIGQTPDGGACVRVGTLCIPGQDVQGRSADGQWLLHRGPAGGAIQVIRVDGAAQHELAADAELPWTWVGDAASVYSPDGRYVVYARPERPQPSPWPERELWVLDLASGGHQRLGPGDAAAWRGGAPWWGP